MPMRFDVAADIPMLLMMLILSREVLIDLMWRFNGRTTEEEEEEEARCSDVSIGLQNQGRRSFMPSSPLRRIILLLPRRREK